MGATVLTLILYESFEHRQILPGISFEPIFQNYVFYIRAKERAGDDKFAMKSSFYLQVRSFFEQLMLLSGNMAIFPLSYTV
ncbi:MAG: hypothetical protein M0Q01_14430, partial [Syntrophales bacterium]|nr:hypothetical protein [Syntrophales bacterium]